MVREKNRHGCLTAWLVLVIVVNSATALMYLVGIDAMRSTLLHTPGWLVSFLIIASLFNLVCAIALFYWKKWGFWGVCISSIAALFINLSIGLGIGNSLIGLIGAAALFGVLQIGNENKGWPQLD